jgi:hypothetical protein
MRRFFHKRIIDSTFPSREGFQVIYDLELKLLSLLLFNYQENNRLIFHFIKEAFMGMVWLTKGQANSLPWQFSNQSPFAVNIRGLGILHGFECFLPRYQNVDRFRNLNLFPSLALK